MPQGRLERPRHGLGIRNSFLIHIMFAHSEDIYLILAYTQMPYALETRNNVVSYGNPHECI
jgi:hypothetical protein